MKLTRERTPKRISATEAAGIEPTAVLDSREAVRDRWDEIVTVVVERLATRDVEDTSTLVKIMDLFHNNRGQVLSELRSKLGPERFTFEYLRPILEKVSFGEDEAAMSSRGPDPLFETRIKKPKAALLKVLFPERADDLLKVVKPAIDELIDKPLYFPTDFVEALRLDPSRAAEILAAAAQQKERMITHPLGVFRLRGAQVKTNTLENVASYVLLFPNERTRILSEFRPVLELIKQQLPTERFWIDILTKGRALEIILHGAELNSNGTFEIQFPKSLTQPPVFPSRSIV